MTGTDTARATWRFVCSTGRLVLVGPLVLVGSALTDVAAALNDGFAWLEGTPSVPVPARRAPTDDSGPDLLAYRRAARVLYAGGFDTAAIADLLTESEADVARWVCKRSDATVPA